MADSPLIWDSTINELIRFHIYCVVRLLSPIWLFATCQAFPVFHRLPEFAQTHVHWVGDIIQPSHPLSSPSPPALGSFPLSHPFASGSKVLELQLQNQSFQWIFGVDFLWDWLVWYLCCPRDQHHNWKASVLWHLAFFIVQLSHPYMTTRNTIALTIWISVGSVMSLLLNMLSRLVIAFLLRAKHLLISWVQSPSTVILEPKKIKSVTVSIFFPIYLPWSDGTRCHDLSFLFVEF